MIVEENSIFRKLFRQSGGPVLFWKKDSKRYLMTEFRRRNDT